MKFSALICLFLSFSFISTAGIAGKRNIVLKSFHATIDNGNVTLTWETEAMQYDVGCNLERSTDGIHFTPVFTTNVKQGWAGTMNYTDRPVEAGTYYYRLFYFKPGYHPFTSKVITITTRLAAESADEVKVVNPFRENIIVNGNFNRGRLSVELSDMNGRLRLQRFIEINAQNQSLSFPARHITRGMYIVSIKEQGGGKMVITRCVYKSFE